MWPSGFWSWNAVKEFLSKATTQPDLSKSERVLFVSKSKKSAAKRLWPKKSNGDGYVHCCEGNFDTYETQRKERLGIDANEPQKFRYKKLNA